MRVIVLASESPTSETGAGAPPSASAPPVPSLTLNPTPGEGTVTDHGPQAVPVVTPNSAPGQQKSTQAVTRSDIDEDAGRDWYLERALVGAATSPQAGSLHRGWRMREVRSGRCRNSKRTLPHSTLWSNPASESRASRTDRRRNGWPSGYELLWGG